jgi:predicted component of type VI protein secretion system
VTAFLITFLAAMIFTAIAVSISDEPILEVVLLTLASTLTAPIPALVAAVLYFRLRELKDDQASAQAAAEGFADSQPPPSVSPPPPPPPPPSAPTS